MLIYTILPNKEVCREASFNEQVITKQKAPSFSRLPIDLSKELSSASFALHTNSTHTAVPDLRSQILYYGSLLRPDSEEKSPLLHLTFRGDNEQIFVRANTPLYLRYDQGKNQWKKVEKSPLKLTFQQKNTTLEVSVELLLPSEKENQGAHPSSTFSITETPSPTSNTANEWVVDGVPITAHVLEKMNARWCGQDAFLNALSNDDRKKECQRIIFDGPDGPYTLWLKEGSCCVLEEGSWHAVEMGQKSQGKTLLYVKAITDTTMTIEIWNPDGSAVISISLNKQVPIKTGSTPSISLIGARSRDAWIASIDSQRILLKTDDWLLCSDGSIEKIESQEQLEAYLHGEKEGTLLAFSGIERVGSERSLTGVMIDPSRTASTPLSISLFHSWNQKENPTHANLIASKSGHNNNHGHHHGKNRYHDDDDDYYDDDDDTDDDDTDDDEDYEYDD